VMRACIICGRPTSTGSRCPDHPKVRVPETRAYKRMRAQILAASLLCHICGKPFTDPSDPAVLDHVRPRAYGGDHSPANLAAAHRSCNARKGSQVTWIGS
jgi:5-methylcytosine-specific restriction endonuclease McrA